MKSATWLYNVRAALKRQAWFTALVSVVLLFSFTISAALRTEQELKSVTGINFDPEQLSRIFGYNYAGVAIPLLIAAFAAGIVFFGYLHQGKQVDFYHSLPISRVKLFWANYAAGAAAALLPWLANLLLTLIIMTALGAGPYLDSALLFAGIGGHVLCFLAIYSLTVLAMLLTGHRLVGGLLGLVFLGFAPLALVLFTWLGEKFYPTWYCNLINWDWWLAHSSPAARYISLLTGDYQYGRLSVGDIYTLLALIGAVLFSCLFFYARRPSETASRALAFPASRIVFKYPLMLLAMAGMGVALYEIGDSSWVWYMIGAGLGGIILSQMVEIINVFDFRAIKTRLLPLLISLALFCSVSLLGIYDVTGYNDFVPEADQVTQVEIVLPGLDIANDYLLNSYGSNDGQRQAQLRYLDITEAGRLERGALTSRESISAAVKIARLLVQQRNAPDNVEIDRDRSRTGAYIRYTLNDGTVKTRAYTINEIYVTDIAAELDAIYAEERFRQGQYSLFSYPADQVVLSGYYVYEDYQDGYVSLLNDVNVSCLEASGLLAVYQKELTALTAQDLRDKTPIGQLEFRLYTSLPTQAEANGSRPCREFDYPLYASMSGALAAMAALPEGAVQPASWFPRYDEVVQAQLLTGLDQVEDSKKYGDVYYPTATVESRDAQDGGEEELITDPAHLRELIDNTHPEAAGSGGFHERDYSRELIVTYRNRYGETYSQTRWFDD